MNTLRHIIFAAGTLALAAAIQPAASYATSAIDLAYASNNQVQAALDHALCGQRGPTFAQLNRTDKLRFLLIERQVVDHIAFCADMGER